MIESALLLFGMRGYEGASTREIAAGAGTTTPPLQYYFNNKEGLYLACIERLAEVFWAGMKDPIDAAEQALADSLDDAGLIEALVTIQAKLTELMFSSKYAGNGLLIGSYQEAGLGPEAGFELINRRLHVPLTRITCAIIGRLIGRPAADPFTVASYLALHGQSLVFISMRRSALASLKWKAYDPPHAALLLEIIANMTRISLTAMVAGKKRKVAK